MTVLNSLADLDGIKRRYREELSNFKYQVSVCGGTGCTSSQCGAVKEILIKLVAEHQLQNQVAVIETGCMGICAVGPILRILPDEIMYTEVNPSKMVEIFASHIIEGKVKEEYTFFDPASDQHIPKMSEIDFFKDQIKIALKNCGKIDYASLEAYIAQDGYSAIAKALQSMTDVQVIEEVKRSDLRERGGDGLLAGIQWEVVKNAKNDLKYIVCNAAEGDPKAIIDRSILEGDPHCVIEGMLLAGYAIGATQGYINVNVDYPLAAKRLGAAIEEARRCGLLGGKILGTNFVFDLEMQVGAGVLVGGGETSLLASMEGKRGEPKVKPPFPFEQGLFDKPTMIHNVETLSHVSPIVLRGADWYAQKGTETSKGTKVFTLTGDIVNQGIVEVPMGMSLGDILFKIGGGVPGGKSFKAVQAGGSSGGYISKEFLNTPVDKDALARLGSLMGSGELQVMNEDTCMVDRARKLMEFIQDQSCGKCLPCRVGTKRMLEIVERFTKGEGQEGDIELLEELADSIRQSSMCSLGQTAANSILSTIQYFREEYNEHVHDKYCRAGVCTDLFVSPCENACPVGINVPGYLALISVGKYRDAYDLIKQENPFPAVCGRICTHPCESKCRRGQLDEPIAIADLKRFVTDFAFEQGVTVSKERAHPKNGKSIGIIGAGPSGLTCGYYLARLGYEVDVYESHSLAGGVLAFGIPEYRLPNETLAYEINLIEQVGVKIHLNTEVGKNISFTQLRKKHDAIYIATGSQISNKINLPSEDLPGVIHGLDFLREVNLGREVQIGKSVVVIGGGNTALDAARTALRLGARVRVLYRRALEDMPADLKEIHEAIVEGIEIMPLVAPLRFIGEEKISELECVRMELGSFDSGGRRRPSVKEGSNFTIQVDTVIPAVSQSADLQFVDRNEVGVSEWNTLITAKDTLMTTLAGVFAGGDVARGSDVAVTAIADGKKAAISMDLFLGGKGVLDKGEDIKFPPATDDADLLDHERYAMEILSPETRKNTFGEVGKGYHKLKAIAESMRCLRCDRR